MVPWLLVPLEGGGGRGRVGDERMPREGCTGRIPQGTGESFQAKERVGGIKYRDV